MKSLIRFLDQQSLLIGRHELKVHSILTSAILCLSFSSLGLSAPTLEKNDNAAIKEYFHFLSEYSENGPSLEYFAGYMGSYWQSDYARCEEHDTIFVMDFFTEFHEWFSDWLPEEDLQQLNQLLENSRPEIMVFFQGESVNFCQLSYCAGYSCTEFYSFQNKFGGSISLEMGFER